MEVLLSSSSSSIISLSSAFTKGNTRSSITALKYPCSRIGVVIPNRENRLTRNLGINGGKIRAIDEVSAVSDPSRVEITWQIIVGTIAGVTPFVVAGIEFSKRIVAQKTCDACKGSGLILREKNYFRCPECGGFLPWQSWKRFFTG